MIQTTIAQPVRLFLDLGPGDELVCRIDDGQAVLTKAKALPRDDSFKTFEEWDSEADRPAYGDR